MRSWGDPNQSIGGVALCVRAGAHPIVHHFAQPILNPDCLTHSSTRSEIHYGYKQGTCPKHKRRDGHRYANPRGDRVAVTGLDSNWHADAASRDRANRDQCSTAGNDTSPGNAVKRDHTYANRDAHPGGHPDANARL